MHVTMHDSREPIMVKANWCEKAKDVPDDYDLYMLEFEQGASDIILYFRDLDHLVDMVRSLSLQVADLRSRSGG